MSRAIGLVALRQRQWFEHRQRCLSAFGTVELQQADEGVGVVARWEATPVTSRGESPLLRKNLAHWTDTRNPS